MSDWYWWLAAAGAAVLLSFALMPVARRGGWMDQPTRRKMHSGPTPLAGGLAVFLAIFFVLYLSGRFHIPFFLGSLIVLLSGLVDDRWPLGASTRFVVQAISCLVVMYLAGVVLSDFGRLMWDGVLNLGSLAVPITIFSALGVINAYNMIDGLDGLAASVYLVCAGALLYLAMRAGHTGPAALLSISMAAVAGFLLLNARFPWNPSARLFLGDSGSIFLGFLLAWLSIDLGSGLDRALAPITAVWIIGIPLLDTTRLIRNRWRAGRSAFAADRRHLHHAFLKAGYSVRQTWLAITGLVAFTAIVGLAMETMGVPEYLRFYAFIAYGLVYFMVMRGVWRRLEAQA